MQNKQKAEICANCQHAGAPFKLGNTTHLYCRHPEKVKAVYEGKTDAIDLLMKFNENCDDFYLTEKTN